MTATIKAETGIERQLLEQALERVAKVLQAQFSSRMTVGRISTPLKLLCRNAPSRFRPTLRATMKQVCLQAVVAGVDVDALLQILLDSDVNFVVRILDYDNYTTQWVGQELTAAG